MPKGKIKKYLEDRGFGFIDDGSRDGLFIHIKNVTNASLLTKGEEVQYERSNGTKGPQAIKVRVLKNAINTSHTNNSVNNQMDKFYNPYNFVRWSEPANDGTEFVRKSPENHWSNEGISGVVKVNVTTESPLFVSGNKVKTHANGHEEYEFHKKDGKYTIPGSSLRGMIRSVYEAVTNSSYSILNENEEDIPLFYRGDTGMAKDLVPARLIKDGEQFKVELLTGHVHNKSRNLMYAAWFPRYKWAAIGNTPYHQRPIPNVSGNIKHGSEVYAILSSDIKHHKRPFFLRSVLEISDEKNNLSDPSRAIRGWYYHSGENMFNKHDERFFYRMDEQDLDGEYQFENMLKSVPNNIVKKYNQLITNYQEVNEDEIKLKKDTNNQNKLSRHLYDNKKVKGGELLYVQLDSDENVEGMYPVMISRRQYNTSILDMLPNHIKHPTNYEDLCPASRLFGWVQGDVGDIKNDDKRHAYKGKVRVSDAILTKENGTIQQTLGILGTPKPTAVAMYLRSKDLSASSLKGKYFDNGYDHQEVTIRGRKMYLSHGNQNPSLDRNIEKSNLNRTINDAMSKGNQFTFEIKVEGLTDVEFGALLWSLSLEKGMHHRLGYGKPFGFGQISVDIDGFEETNITSLYTTWEEKRKSYSKIELDNYIELFKQEMQKAFNCTFENIIQVVDMVAILTPSEKRSPIQYPVPFKSSKIFDWFVNNSRGKKSRYNEVLPFPSEEKDFLLKN
ncbi:TIGR03986 family CRISPR-associated RAMP protein [Lottiidibacillus patelloidae]|uniref:TIGR03986 family CRISPR-associated RAMP protein n=1 Tax=Lottiidibacillus patelloidae TaxID=2670334 RepID=A0A263BRB6_9BACI|nr:TIGR03986 family CRISPR-associated RAMP protein [Lottiidibacillus patelloidae]OZM56245.1 TIGR03986 family CRISPR-associated RAMP protein [Lottiidibacillus patelloidae]